MTLALGAYGRGCCCCFGGGLEGVTRALHWTRLFVELRRLVGSTRHCLTAVAAAARRAQLGHSSLLLLLLLWSDRRTALRRGLHPAAVEAHDLEAVVGEAALRTLPVLQVRIQVSAADCCCRRRYPLMGRLDGEQRRIRRPSFTAGHRELALWRCCCCC